MYKKLILFIALLAFFACSNNSEEQKLQVAANEPLEYGAILTSVACPIFYDWLRPTHIKSTDQVQTSVFFAETHLNCQGNYSINRKTSSIFIPLPVGNYFLKQIDNTHQFELTFEESNAFSFKVAPNRITYIGEITVKAVPDTDISSQLNLQIEVGDMLNESLMLARTNAPDYMDDYPIDKMLWRPVIETSIIYYKALKVAPKKPWIKETTPDGFF